MSGPRLRHHPESLWRYSLRGVLVCPPGTDESQLVSRPADAVWTLLDEPISIDELVEVLAPAFGAPADQVHHDVTALVDRLLELGAVEQVD